MERKKFQVKKGETEDSLNMVLRYVYAERTVHTVPRNEGLTARISVSTVLAAVSSMQHDDGGGPDAKAQHPRRG